MINQRASTINVNQMRDMLSTSGLNIGVEVEELTKFARMYQTYESAQHEIATKLENLDAEFQMNYNHNPIHHLEGRMKDPQSLFGKLQRKNLPMTVDIIPDNIFDIAGIRVITNYIDDIYTVERLLVAQDDVTLLKCKDYVENPKPSGYRSLHLVVEIPVFRSTGVERVPVEIQIRTIAMDFWAALEHKIFYKYDGEVPDHIVEELTEAAAAAEILDHRMEQLHRQVHGNSSFVEEPQSPILNEEVLQQLWEHARRSS